MNRGVLRWGLGIAFAGIPSAARAQASLIIVVRHAEKELNAGNDPGLLPMGLRRAESLSEALNHAKLDAIFTTQFRRNRLTADPVARKQGIRPSVVDAGADEQEHARAIVDRLNRMPRGASALVVEHSNTIPLILRALASDSGVRVCDGEYATMFIISRQPGDRVSMVRVRYGAADPAAALGCHREAEPE